MGEEWLENRPTESDIGVLLINQLCALVAKRTNPILECIKCSIMSWISSLRYPALMWSTHLEYCVSPTV